MQVLPKQPSGRTTRRSLIESLQSQGPGTRWAEFDQIYRDIVMNIAMASGLQFHDAQDVTQNVFAELVERLANFKLGARPGSFRAYLRRLVRWRAGNQHQRNHRMAAVSLDSEETPEIPAAEPPDTPDYESVIIGAMKAMSRDLKLRDLQVLELIHCSRWPPDQVAAALQISRQCVYQITSRHRERLEREVRRRMPSEL